MPPREDFIQRLIGAKNAAQNKMQALGSRLASNVMQGQKNIQAGYAQGKMPSYNAINPIK